MSYKITELRIGNLFIDKKTTSLLLVDELTKDNVSFYVVDRRHYPLPAGWEAIPLLTTPESLVMCGFKKSERFDIWRIDETDVEVNKNGDKYEACINDEAGYRIAAVDYIYQVQNLYLLITGEELKINFDVL